MTERLHEMGSQHREGTDEDLALFHDMRRRERRNFLCPLKDDMDAASPKEHDGLSSFNGLALTPTRNGHDLLNMDPEKNDYDWLLTPPSTPLFPSLDQDVPIKNLSQRRVLTRSTSVSKPTRLSYPQEPSLRMLGGHPSPRRPSTASSTSSSIATSSNRGRPLSPSLTSRSSLTVRSSSPCRPGTPTVRNPPAPSIRLTSRSLTPTLRRNNTSPSPASAGFTNGKSRGKSLSPKLGPCWEPYLPGFSVEPPPNLRTTLSDRTLQRGGGPQAIRNGATARTRGGAFSDTPLQQWHVGSPEGSGSWNLCYANDYNSSQTSRASVVSSCDDDLEMAESALSASVRTSSGSGSRATNVSSMNRENPSPKRCILPAKRQMRPAGANRDAPNIFSVAARKSYERQAAQRHSPQAMFRPLLSSVPSTSFYSGRSGGPHLRSSIPLVDFPATMNGSPHIAEGHGGLASSTSTHQRADVVIDGSNVWTSMEEERGASVEEEAEAHEHGLEVRASNKNGNGLIEIVDHVPMKQVEDGDERDNHHNISMAEKMDETTIGCLKGEDAEREHNSVLSITDALPPALSPAEHGEECSNTPEANKMKGHHVEEQRPVKTQSYAGMTTYTGSPHGSHRLVVEFGSFRRQSPMKASTPRSHDGSMAVEKAASCDSFASDSYGLARSLASALSNCEPVEVPMVRSPRDGMDTSFCEESCDGLESQAPDLMPIDGSVDSSDSSTSLCHECKHELVKDDATTKDSISEPSTLQVEDPLFVEKLDKPFKQDVLSIIGSWASKVISGHDDAIEHVFQEEGATMQLGRSIDAPCMNSRAAREFSEEGESSLANNGGVETLHKDDPSQTTLSPLTRSITLHEATDTILFCSSIVHELVYKAAALAIQEEEDKVLSSRGDFITIFGLARAEEYKGSRGKAAKPRIRKQPTLGDSVVCERSSYVQKQRMVHRQTPAITMRQSPMDRIENAVMENNEEIEILPKITRVGSKKKKKKKKTTTSKQAKGVQCGCSCCMM